jgi:hypothetical protein
MTNKTTATPTTTLEPIMEENLETEEEILER